jgi:hypothetical protein
LADWASPYITDYLGKAQALSAEPYEVYKGPLTAGESGLQTQAFQGIGNLTVPSSLTSAANTAGSLASSAGSMSYSPTSFTNQYSAPTSYSPVGGSFTDAGVSQQYMNPYLQNALNPTLDELRRQSQISQLENDARFTKAGAFGGSRQALSTTENQRNLLSQMARTAGEGYASAYDKGANQYNTEQQRRIQESQFGSQQNMTAAELMARYGLSAQEAAERSRQFGAGYGLDALKQRLSAAQLQGQLGQNEAEQQRANLAQQLGAGAIQRGITSEGVAADLGEFNAQREFPYKQLQFQRDMISGLPTGSVTNTPAQLSGIAQLVSSIGGIDALLKATGQKDLGTLLKSFGLNFGGSGGELV